MRLGISSYTYTWSIGVGEQKIPCPMNVFGLVEKADRHGVNCIQVADNLPLENLTQESKEQLKVLLEKKKIGIEVGMRGLTEENLDKYIDLATYFNSPILRVVVDGKDYHPSIEEIVTKIKVYRKTFEDNKLILAIENHDRFKALEFKYIVESCESDYVGICLDSVNSMGASEDIERVAATLAPYVVNLHIKDFTIRRIWHMMGFEIEGTPAGEGMLPIEKLLKEIASFKRCQSGILELWTPPGKDILESVEKEELWAERSIRHLRNYISD